MGDFCYVVRYCYIATTKSCKDGQVASSREIGTEKAAAADFQFNTKQRVLNVHASRGTRFFEVVGAGAELANALAIDSWQPRFAELFLDPLSVDIIGRHFHTNWATKRHKNHKNFLMPYVPFVAKTYL